MHNMFHAGTDMVVVRRIKNLSLVFKAAKGLAVKNAGIVALKVCSYIIVTPIKRNLALYCLFPFWVVLVTSVVFE